MHEYELEEEHRCSTVIQEIKDRINKGKHENIKKTKRNRSSAIDIATGRRTRTFQWENRDFPSTQPEPRSGHTINIAEQAGIAVLFGGLGDRPFEDSDPVLNDTWVCDLCSFTWKKIEADGDPPPPLVAHTAHLVNENTNNLCLLVFGGQGMGGRVSGETYILCNILHEPMWYRIPTRCSSVSHFRLERWGHSMVAYEEEEGELSVFTQNIVPKGGNLHLIVFGGVAGYDSCSDLLAFDVYELVWRVLATSPVPYIYTADNLSVRVHLQSGHRLWPSGRRRHVAVLDSKKRMWIFGGRTKGDQFLGDLWFYDFTAEQWFCVVRKHTPSPRTGHCGVLHGFRLYIFGGFQFTQRDMQDGFSSLQYTLFNDVHCFNIEKEIWEPITTKVSSLEQRKSKDKTFNHSCELFDRSGTMCCTYPRERSMAVCFIWDGRLFVHGGRNKDFAFNCTFSLPLPVQAKNLKESIALYVVNSQIDISCYKEKMPADVMSLLNSIFAPELKAFTTNINKHCVDCQDSLDCISANPSDGFNKEIDMETNDDKISTASSTAAIPGLPSLPDLVNIPDVDLEPLLHVIGDDHNNTTAVPPIEDISDDDDGFDEFNYDDTLLSNLINIGQNHFPSNDNNNNNNNNNNYNNNFIHNINLNLNDPQENNAEIETEVDSQMNNNTTDELNLPNLCEVTNVEESTDFSQVQHEQNVLGMWPSFPPLPAIPSVSEIQSLSMLPELQEMYNFMQPEDTETSNIQIYEVSTFESSSNLSPSATDGVHLPASPVSPVSPTFLEAYPN